MSLPFDTVRMLKYIDHHKITATEVIRRFGIAGKLRYAELLEAGTITDVFSEAGIGVDIILTPTGKKLLEDRRSAFWLDVLAFLGKSILAPIVVAFITAAITSASWPAIRQWIQAML